VYLATSTGAAQSEETPGGEDVVFGQDLGVPNTQQMGQLFLESNILDSNLTPAHLTGCVTSDPASVSSS
jgi:hypothetical protein